MLSVVIKRSADANTVQLTQKSMLKELWNISGSELLIEDTWLEGLKKVRTPMVCLVEPDCVLSSNYLGSNFRLMSKYVLKGGKGGGYNKNAMLASCLGVNNFGNRIYNYKLQTIKDRNMKYFGIVPFREKGGADLYNVQVGFVPGAILRMKSIGRDLDILPWDEKNLVKMSTAISFHLWSTGRRIEVNPNTTYVSNEPYLEDPPIFDSKLSDTARNVFVREGF